MSAPVLISAPNLSTESEVVAAAVRDSIEQVPSARVLDTHTDTDHGRMVITFAAHQGDLRAGLCLCAAAAVERIDITGHRGIHPHVGALDVAPVVYLDAQRRGAACAEALTAAALIAEDLELGVFLYGELATHPSRRERASLRTGGAHALAERIEAGELRPDFGPARMHPTAGYVLVTARPPLIAFNFNLKSADVATARQIAAALRESDGGFVGVRALGLYLATRGLAQVSLNIHDYHRAPLHEIADVVRSRADVLEAELVGMAPREAFEGFPTDLPIRDFCAQKQLLDNALGCGL